jgi:hypothetical protein
MSNPLSQGTLTTFPLASNLTSLPSGQAMGLGSLPVGQTTPATQYYDDNIAPIQITSGASGVSASGTASLYVVCSEDNTHWTGGVNPAVTADQSAALATLPALSTIAVVANATIYWFPEFSIYDVLGFMPAYWSVVIYNKSGAAFASSGFIAQHSLISYV